MATHDPLHFLKGDEPFKLGLPATVSHLSVDGLVGSKQGYRKSVEFVSGRHMLTIVNEPDSTKTFLHVIFADDGTFRFSPSPEPPLSQISDHREYVAIVDSCVMFTVGRRTSADTRDRSLSEIDSTYPLHYKEISKTKDSATGNSFSATGSMPVSYSATISIAQIEDTFNLVQQAIERVSVAKVLRYYSRGQRDPEHTFVEWYKCIEFIKGDAELLRYFDEELTKRERRFLKALPQIQRHDDGTKHFADAEAFLQSEYPKALTDQSYAVSRYRSLLTKLIRSFAYLDWE